MNDQQHNINDLYKKILRVIEQHFKQKIYLISITKQLSLKLQKKNTMS